MNNAIFPVYFFINTEIRAAVSARGGTSLVSTYPFRRGEEVPIEIEFTRSGTSVTTQRVALTTYGSFKFTGKFNADWDGFTVFSVTSFSSVTKSVSGVVVTYYKGNLDLSGTTLSNLFVPKNLASLSLQSEFEWTDRLDGVTYVVNSQPFKLTIENDLID